MQPFLKTDKCSLFSSKIILVQLKDTLAPYNSVLHRDTFSETQFIFKRGGN